MDPPRLSDELAGIAEAVRQSWQEERRVLSLGEYLELLEADPLRHTRDAARYLRDAVVHHGTVEVSTPAGRRSRYHAFDLPFLDPSEAAANALVGHEALQEGLVRSLGKFAREGRANRVLFLHGPNGSAKTTALGCLHRILEHYSTLPEGALYRFHWVFPDQGWLKGAIGFRGGEGGATPASFAHLPEEAVATRLAVEVRDHPLFLLPEAWRRAWLARVYRGHHEAPPAWLVQGSLCHKSRQVHEALLLAYRGDLGAVLRHVQVERYFISRRYRVGAITLGPEVSVDAAERQLTADRSLASLPASLQSVTLFEAHGELIDAAGGLLELSDLLKRPIDAFKYLQITAETGEVSLASQTLQLNTVLAASANEPHLEAFRRHPEFDSFWGRFEPLRVPYLLSFLEERRIYEAQLLMRPGTTAAPHAITVAAEFAVLSRLRRPDPARHDPEVRELVAGLGVLEKLDLYSLGKPPERLEEDARRALVAAIPALLDESAGDAVYEGCLGASPREIRGVLLDAAHDPRFDALSPFAVLDRLDALCLRENEYPWLGLDAEAGGYHDHVLFRRALRERLLDRLEDELRTASGLVEPGRFSELFQRYVTQVSHWVKGERPVHPVTGQPAELDGAVLTEVEGRLGQAADPGAFRHAVMGRVAAFAIDHPDQPIDAATTFAAEIRRLREAVFVELKGRLTERVRALVRWVRDDGAGLDGGARRDAAALVEALAALGYTPGSAADAAAALLRERLEPP